MSPTSPYAFTRPPVHATKPKHIQKVFICKMGIYRYYYIIISKFQLLRKEIEKVSFTIKWLIIAHITFSLIVKIISVSIFSIVYLIFNQFKIYLRLLYTRRHAWHWINIWTMWVLHRHMCLPGPLLKLGSQSLFERYLFLK